MKDCKKEFDKMEEENQSIFDSIRKLLKEYKKNTKRLQKPPDLKTKK